MSDRDAADLGKKKLAGGGAYGNAVIFSGSLVLTAVPVTADIFRLCDIPAGVKVNAIIVTNTDLGTAVPATPYITPNDGSSATQVGGTALALGTAAPNGVLVAGAPIEVQKPSKLTMTIGTVDTGATGSVHVTVLGENVGLA